jgi:two-component system phosphate regulon sensor histidine kinase PhoR
MDTDKNHLDESREAFVMALAHKLRTPLNGARWALESAMEKSEGKEKETLLAGHEKILESINIVSDILNSIKPDGQETFHAKKEKVDFVSVIDKILDNLQFLRHEKNVNLKYNKIDSATIYADKKLLDLGLTNLFDNAFRYSPEGNVEVTISKEGQNVVLTIKDNGIGISKEDLAKMYEKFHRGKNAMELDPDENGVGMYTTKKVIDLHDGTIDIQSELGKGTTVTVNFPLN